MDIYLITTIARRPRRILTQDRFCKRHWLEREGRPGYVSSRSIDVTVTFVPASDEECDECEYDARLARMTVGFGN